MSRRTDRRHVFCLIFQLEFLQGANINVVFDSYMEHHASEPVDSEFILKEFTGVYQNLEKIDAIISETLKAWTTDRLNKSDFAILRLAVYEIMYNDEIPNSVAINEAVELAKIYCDDSSPGSVNAILGAILKSGVASC